MSELKFRSEPLIKLQEYSWYFLLVYFLFAVVVDLLNFSIPFHVGYVGALIVLFLTLLKLILMAEQFRQIKLIRLTYLAYLLLLIVISTIIVRLYL